MKNVIVASLLGIYILLSTHTVEILKFPMLYNHFVEHQKEDRTMSFADFVFLHYGEQHGHQSHKNLPFKSIKFLSFYSIAIENSFTVIEKLAVEVVSHEPISHYQSTYQFHFLNQIWQPPRA